MGNLTSMFDVANSNDFYNGETFNALENVMNDPTATAELNNKVTNYIYENLNGQMYANPEGQGYDNYTIPDKFKNGSYTLDELFTSASEEFGVPKEILVATSQHECSQDYMPINSYTSEREQNCGGMMGIIDVNNIHPGFLPQGGTDGVGTLNPALSIYSYAASLRFNYDYFKNLDLGYGLDAWDVAVGINAVGIGNFRNPEMGFTKQESDYITNLNTVLPEYKALREAYAEGRLGVNDLTIEVANGSVVDWSDGQEMIYNYESGANNQADIALEEKQLDAIEYKSASSESTDRPKRSAVETLSTNISGEENEVEVLDDSLIEDEEKIDNTEEVAERDKRQGYVWSNGATSSNASFINSNFNGVSSNASTTSDFFGVVSSNSADTQKYDNVATSNVGLGMSVGAAMGIKLGTKGFIGVRTQELEYFVTDICNKTIKETIRRIESYMLVFNALENGWAGKSLENFEDNYRKAVVEVKHAIYQAYFTLVKEISDVANGMIEQDQKMIDII